MKIATEKVWLTEDKKLVKDGDPKAHELLAAKGQTIDEKRLKDLEHVDKFFHDTKHPAKTVATEAAAERHDRTIKPESHRGGK